MGNFSKVTFIHEKLRHVSFWDVWEVEKFFRTEPHMTLTECHTLLSSIRDEEWRRGIVAAIIKDGSISNWRKFLLAETLSVLEKSIKSVTPPSILTLYYAIRLNKDGTARLLLKNILQKQAKILEENEEYLRDEFMKSPWSFSQSEIHEIFTSIKSYIIAINTPSLQQTS